MSSTIIDLHILHTVPPSNLNRDDTGSPKTATYGGVRRARVSSQAWKRATRRDFADHLDESELGERTRYVVDKIAQQISRIDSDLDQEEAANRAAAALAATGIKVTEPKGKGKDPRATTGYLLFLSRPQIVALAELGAAAEDGKVDKKAAKEVLKKGNSIDLALFGRMVADVPELNVDAACQVAHAISVHPVDNEFDYFTAVDDNGTDEHAGAGMIGTVEFNSSTLYRFATVDVDELAQTLGSVEAAARAVSAFVQSFVTSMPTGKQNTFANRTRPDFVLATVRADQSVNLVGAFEDPIREQSGRVATAAARLIEYGRDQDTAFDTRPVAALSFAVGSVLADGLMDDHSDFAEDATLPQMRERLSAIVSERVTVTP